MNLSSLWRVWDQCKTSAIGRKTFSFLFGKFVPYTGSIGAEIVELSVGNATVAMRDSRKLRNHLKSLHAIALANLGEATTGLAVNYDLPENMRAILVRFEIDYLKKARGTIKAICRIEPQKIKVGDVIVEGVLQNSASETVAKIRAIWKVGEKK